MWIRASTARTCGYLVSGSLAAAVIVGCGSVHGPGSEKTGTTSEAVTAIQISGHVVDANGLSLPGVTVTLAGTTDLTLTDSGGNYAFTGLAPGSYSVRPTFNQCSFSPEVVNLNNLNANATQNFTGSGSGCGGSPSVNTGATTGSLTITGHLKDASGNAVVGAEITLSGAGSGVRFSDFTGAYTFSVNPGSYALTTSGSCSFNPSNVNLNNLTASVTQNVTATTTGCTVSTVVSQNPTGSVLNVTQAGQPLGTVYAHVEQRLSAADALARLQQIVSEQPVVPVSLTISGNPAIERQTTVPLDGFELQDSDENLPPPAVPLSLTGALAIGSNVLRFESKLPPTPTATTISAFFHADRNLDPSTITAIQGATFQTAPVATGILTVPPAPLPTTPLFASTVSIRDGELQVAASDTVNAVVYGLQNAVFHSNDGGNTVLASMLNFVSPPPLGNGGSKGDPSVGVGAPNGVGQNFWFSEPEISKLLTSPLFLTAIGLYKSTDNGATFNAALTPFPVNCASPGTQSLCAVTDQPQLAVDRVTQAFGAAGARHDQLYLAWRNALVNKAGTGYAAPVLVVACSFDETMWNVDATTLVATGGDFARLNVAPDGSLLVAYQIVQSNGNYQLAVQKFSSCQSGFHPQFGQGSPSFIHAPANAATFSPVPDLAGLDRPPSANHFIAADTTDFSGHRVFATYANQTSSGTDIHVAESFDGAQTWTGGANDVIVNSVSTGNRFFPWICTTGGTAFVSWYDRRAATLAQQDLTAYFRSSVVDTANGLVTAPVDINVSGVNDEECSSGFPSGTSGPTEELLCGMQDLPGSATDPIPAGTCDCAPDAGSTCGGQACDQRFPTAPNACTTNETCGAFGGGVPKYGDYNGNACALGRLFMAWASSTPPPGACAGVGTACPTTVPACPGLECFLGTVAPIPSCLQPGSACTTPGTPCCSGVCEAGICAPSIAVYANSTTCTANCPAPSPVQPPFSRSYSAHECEGPSLEYTTNGVEVGNRGGTTAFCPLVNDSILPLNGTLGPVRLNGTVTIENGSGTLVMVEGCTLDSQAGALSCGSAASLGAGNHQVQIDTSAWALGTNDDNFFISVDTGFNNTATLWSYDTEQ